jgi:tetratricopeptide (TPR) repeat protein
MLSNQFWKRLSNISGFFALTAIFALLVFVANMEVKDLDLWLHLGMGRAIVNNGFQVPAVDILSCTIPGKPWVNHEWLFQVIVYAVHQLWGFAGLINMQVILASVTMFILLSLGYSKEKQLGTIFMLLLVSLVYQSRFTIRPDLYSLLFFALDIFILSFYLDKKWSLYALFILQILWTNMHGFFFFGPLFVLIGLAAEWVKRHIRLPYEWNEVGRLTDDEYRRLRLILGAVILACLFNPLTLEGAWYPIKVFLQISGEHKIFFDKIIELKKPITSQTLFSVEQYPFYKLMIVVTFLSFVYNRWRIEIGSLVFWFIFLFFSLAAIRNMIYFAFASYLVFITNILNVSLRDVVPVRFADKKFMYIVSIALKVFLIVWIINFGGVVSLNGYFDFDRYERKSEFGGVSLRAYPNKAVDFLVTNEVKGNFFNDFNSGAYLVGRAYPDIKVFIDGRTEVYGPEFFRFYQSIWEFDDADEFEKALNRYGVTGVLLNSVYQPIPDNVLKRLSERKEWVPVYFDYDAMIFLKDVPRNQAVIAQHRLDLTQWQGKPFDLYRLGAVKVTPYQHIHRAFTLESLGLYDQAMIEIEKALKISPNYLDPYSLRGKIFAKRKEYQKAFEDFRIAVVFAPDNQPVRINLAWAYFDLGYYQYSLRESLKIIERWPDYARGYFLLASNQFRLQRREEGLRSLRKAHALEPKEGAQILKIGDLLIEQRDYPTAIQVYALALEVGEKKDEAFLKLGEAYQKMGEPDKAKAEFEKGLQVNPDHEIIKRRLEESNPRD